MRWVLDARNPAPRRLQQVVDVLEQGGVIAYPTDTVYGLGADLLNKRAVERIYQIRQMPKQKPLSLICADLSEISRYAQVTDAAYRLMRRLLPGPYTFVLEATKQVPSALVRGTRDIAATLAEDGGERAQLPRRERTVGIRVPDSPICQALVRGLGRPLVNTSCVIDGEVMRDPEEIDRRLGKQLAVVVDTGLLGDEPSTVVSLVDDEIEVLRAGKGAVDAL